LRILVVEDMPDIAKAIAQRFEKIGHAVDCETDGRTASEVLRVQDYDLIILDMMLPGADGFEILKGLRGRKDKTPVLVLTARSAVDDRVDVLDLGADDYLTKPFDFRELEDLVIDRAGRTASVADTALDLTRRELIVLEILAARPKRFVSKEELVEQLFNFDQEPSANAVEQYVTRLRRKLADTSIEIRTSRGLGYQLASK